MRRTVYFDAWIRKKNGTVVPYYDYTFIESEVEDQTLMWFHEGYGLMKLYRLHKVDEENYIAEKTKGVCRTSDPKWKSYLEDPNKALL